jgi:hypothetical protein
MKKLIVTLLAVIAVFAGGLFLLDLATKNSDYPLFQRTDNDPEGLRRFTSGYDFFDESGMSQPPFVAAVTWTVAQQVVILTDSTFQPLLPSSSTMIRNRSLLTANGQEILVSYETADRKTFSRITIAGKAYQYTNGNTFLVSLKDGEVQVLQVKDSKLQRIRVTAPATSGLQTYRRGPFNLDMNLHAFRREDADARMFFSHLPETR